jgi:alpha-tubulin suppressor-like RCC1 family protein
MIVQIATGAEHSCAIAAAGELFCWGSNAEGQLGAGSMQLGAEVARSDGAVLVADGGGPAARFVQVPDQAAQVTAGAAHTCALGADGSVRCWGRDAEGQVDGMARAISVQSPVLVDIGTATALDAGDQHTCAVVAKGVVCWGSARYGQVGREVADAALAPALVAGTAGALDVAAGTRHSCARLAGGHVVCWGELIDAASGEAVSTADAVEVAELDDATAIAAGAGHSCALRASGAVVCWGANQSGQLGDGTTQSSAKPVAVKGLTRALRVAAGGGERDGQLVGHSCAVDTQFFVQCWGRNAEGQLGIGQGDDRTKPTLVLGPAGESDTPYLDNIVTLDTGAFHSCAVDHDGPALCWGDDSFGQLGSRTDRTPTFGRATRVGRFER